MISRWLPELFILVYPLIGLLFQRVIRRHIPQKRIRKQFLRSYDYIKKLLYLFLPIMVFHLELILLRAEYPFFELSKAILVTLVVLQSCIFFISVLNFHQFFGELKKFGQYLKQF